jgi:hypothetical protein
MFGANANNASRGHRGWLRAVSRLRGHRSAFGAVVAWAFVLMGAPACTSECKGVEVDLAVEGPAEATAASVALISGQTTIVMPGRNKPDGQLVLGWQSPRLGTELRVPELRFGLVGPQDARALGAVLCWCPGGVSDCLSGTQSAEPQKVRCVELSGTLDITRYELVETDLGEERDVDLLLDVEGADGDATVSAELHVLLKDHIVTFECDSFKSPISRLGRPSEQKACLLARR